MSWKSLVCAGLVCVVASPVLAAPGLTVDLLRSGGLPVLDSSNNWQWVVSVDPDEALFHNPPDVPDRGLGGSVAAEVGFTASGSNLVSGAKNATNFPSNNIGNSPFAAPINGEQEGVVSNGNNLFAALGSEFFTTGTLKEMLIIKTVGPSTAGSLTSTLTWSGAYNTDGTLGGTNGRLAQMGMNFNNIAGSLSKTAKAGDTNLNGSVTIADFGILQNNFGGTGKIWTQGDFNGTGSVTIADFGILQNNFGQSAPPPGSGAVVGVPEPASLALVALAALGVAGLVRRRK